MKKENTSEKIVQIMQSNSQIGLYTYLTNKGRVLQQQICASSFSKNGMVIELVDITPKL